MASTKNSKVVAPAVKIAKPAKTLLPTAHANGAAFSEGRPGKLAFQLALLSGAKGITKGALIDALCANFGDGSPEDRKRQTATVSGQLGGQWRGEKGIIVKKEGAGSTRLYSVDFELTAAYLALPGNETHKDKAPTRFATCTAFLKKLQETKVTKEASAAALAIAKGVKARAQLTGAVKGDDAE